MNYQSETMKYAWVIYFFVQNTVSCFKNDITYAFESNISSLDVGNKCEHSLDLIRQNLNLDNHQDIDVGGQFARCYKIQPISAEEYCFKLLSPQFNAEEILKTNWSFIHDQLFQNSSRKTTYQKRPITDATISEISICLPASCTSDDVSEIFVALIGSKTTSCEMKDVTPLLTTYSIFTIVILSLVVLMMIVSTTYDFYCNYNKLEPRNFLVAFSVIKNGRMLFDVNRNSSELQCLNGIKVLSMLWIITLHTFSNTAQVYFPRDKDFLEWEDSWRSVIIRSGIFGADSFLVIGGTLVTYSFMGKRMKDPGERFHICRYYLHRYLRLTPALAAAMLVCSALSNVTGPDKSSEPIKMEFQYSCHNYWWASLLYIQNYVNNGRICFSPSWYLSVDMQLYVLSPVILLPLWKWPRKGLVVLLIFMLTSIVVPFYVVYKERVVGRLGLITHEYDIKFYKEHLYHYYYKTHTRAVPWFMGLLLGYVLHGLKHQSLRKPKLRKVVVFFLWIKCFFLMLICMFSAQYILRGPEYNRLGNTFYIGLIKPAWSLCTIWIILACVLGYGGPVNWILSHAINQFLLKFTYSMYIIHFPIILFLNYFSEINNGYFSVFNLVCFSSNIIIFSYLLSVVWILAFESPMATLEKYLNRLHCVNSNFK